MKVSDIPLGQVVRIQTPTDAMRIFPVNAKNGQEWHRQEFIKSFGDVDVVRHVNSLGQIVWLVPEFAQEIDRYCRSKAKDIEKWGC